MLFPFDPVYGLDDVSQNFEALQGLDILDSAPQDFLQLLASGGQRLAFGTVQKTAAANATIAIPHGLGTTPVIAGGFPLGWAGYLGNQAPDATNINLFPSVAITSAFIYWFAIG